MCNYNIKEYFIISKIKSTPEGSSSQFSRSIFPWHLNELSGRKPPFSSQFLRSYLSTGLSGVDTFSFMGDQEAPGTIATARKVEGANAEDGGPLSADAYVVRIQSAQSWHHRRSGGAKRPAAGLRQSCAADQRRARLEYLWCGPVWNGCDHRSGAGRKRAEVAGYVRAREGNAAPQPFGRLLAHPLRDSELRVFLRAVLGPSVRLHRGVQVSHGLDPCLRSVLRLALPDGCGVGHSGAVLVHHLLLRELLALAVRRSVPSTLAELHRCRAGSAAESRDGIQSSETVLRRVLKPTPR
eukprot:scaffold895_cov315-Pinguiococcus_pyrenoidosus.AAC.32